MYTYGRIAECSAVPTGAITISNGQRFLTCRSVIDGDGYMYDGITAHIVLANRHILFSRFGIYLIKEGNVLITGRLFKLTICVRSSYFHLCRTNELIIRFRSISGCSQGRCSGINCLSFRIDDVLIRSRLDDRTTCIRSSGIGYEGRNLKRGHIERDRIHSL